MTHYGSPEPSSIVYRAVLQDEPSEHVPFAAEVRIGTGYGDPVIGEASDFRRADGALTAKLIIDPARWAAHIGLLQEGEALYAGNFKVIGPEQ